MDTAELLKKVRRIEIKTRRLSSDLFAGEYHSAFKGRGMEFAEVREYQFGDDIRAIDWNVTARLNSPYIKIFEEERELTLNLILDLSPSAYFGTAGQGRHDMIAELAAVLGFAAINNDDKVGCILFTDQVELYVPPKKGRPHMLRIIREILEFGDQLKGNREQKKRPKKTDIAEALRYFMSVQRKKSTAFIFSDFLDEGYEAPLRIASRKHDIVGVHVHDRRERDLPNMGIIQAWDPESDRYIWRRTNKKLRQHVAKRYDELQTQFREIFRRVGSDVIGVDSSIPEEHIRQRNYVTALHRFFRSRGQRG
jgi:uncharacterized protein (DUF58 family)